MGSTSKSTIQFSLTSSYPNATIQLDHESSMTWRIVLPSPFPVNTRIVSQIRSQNQTRPVASRPMTKPYAME
eukprot:scaffold151148_cov18-Tisochrysis_lutea.AAC.2